MAATDTIQIDLDLVEELTKRETAALDEKHARSISYLEEARTRLPGGVSSSWQSWPPHPIYVDRGEGSHVWDIDGNEYVDLHNGYGVMVMGHAHPKIVEAVRGRVALGTHFAQPTEDALPVAGGGGAAGPSGGDPADEGSPSGIRRSGRERPVQRPRGREEDVRGAPA